MHFGQPLICCAITSETIQDMHFGQSLICSAITFETILRRMNVAITRAKRHLILVGCGRTLPTHESWKVLIDRARSQSGGMGYIGSRDMQMAGEIELVEDIASGSEEILGATEDADGEGLSNSCATKGGVSRNEGGRRGPGNGMGERMDRRIEGKAGRVVVQKSFKTGKREARIHSVCMSRDSDDSEFEDDGRVEHGSGMAGESDAGEDDLDGLVRQKSTLRKKIVPESDSDDDGIKENRKTRCSNSRALESDSDENAVQKVKQAFRQNIIAPDSDSDGAEELKQTRCRITSEVKRLPDEDREVVEVSGLPQGKCRTPQEARPAGEDAGFEDMDELRALCQDAKQASAYSNERAGLDAEDESDDVVQMDVSVQHDSTKTRESIALDVDDGADDAVETLASFRGKHSTKRQRMSTDDEDRADGLVELRDSSQTKRRRTFVSDDSADSEQMTGAGFEHESKLCDAKMHALMGNDSEDSGPAGNVVDHDGSSCQLMRDGRVCVQNIEETQMIQKLSGEGAERECVVQEDPAGPSLLQALSNAESRDEVQEHHCDPHSHEPPQVDSTSPGVHSVEAAFGRPSQSGIQAQDHHQRCLFQESNSQTLHPDCANPSNLPSLVAVLGASLQHGTPVRNSSGHTITRPRKVHIQCFDLGDSDDSDEP